MSNVSTKRTIPRFQKKTEYYDYSLVAVMILLIVFGLIMLYSTSSYVAQLHEGNDMFYFTVHHAKGRYTNGEGKPVDVPHGLSGGNGIGTLVDSTGNEFSHEVGHGYGMGHYPFLNDASDGAVHGYTTSWGYDAYKNRMRANVAWNSTPQAVMYQDKWYIPFAVCSERTRKRNGKRKAFLPLRSVHGYMRSLISAGWQCRISDFPNRWNPTE